jgi:hypothetical protein
MALPLLSGIIVPINYASINPTVTVNHVLNHSLEGIVAYLIVVSLIVIKGSNQCHFGFTIALHHSKKIFSKAI